MEQRKSHRIGVQKKRAVTTSTSSSFGDSLRAKRRRATKTRFAQARSSQRECDTEGSDVIEITGRFQRIALSSARAASENLGSLGNLMLRLEFCR